MMLVPNLCRRNAFRTLLGSQVGLFLRTSILGLRRILRAMSDSNAPLMDTLTILCIRCAIHWAIWFGFSCWLKTGGRTRLYVHAHHVFHIVACRVPEPAVPLHHAGILDVFQ